MNKYLIEEWPPREERLDVSHTRPGVRVTDLRTGTTVVCNRHRWAHANRREAIELLRKHRAELPMVGTSQRTR